MRSLSGSVDDVKLEQRRFTVSDFVQMGLVIDKDKLTVVIQLLLTRSNL